MKKVLILILVFASTLLVLNCLPVHGEEAIYDSVVRLHVIANSDSDTDQALKLKVRDAVLASMPEILGNADDRESALENLSKNLERVRLIAQNVVNSEGYDYTVSVALGDEKYPTKSYENVCFPAGVYKSLQIKIGDADGKNWWCVLFPQLCLSGTKKAESAFIEVGLTSDQYKVITETENTKYKIRFKVLEAFGEVFN